MQGAGAVRDVILRDGETLRLRWPTAADGNRVLSFFARLSQRSLVFRFHGLRAIGPGLVEPFLEPDGVDRCTLIGTMGEDAEERVVAVASWVRLRDPTCAEVAFAVEDALQGKGVGTRLLEQLAELAGEAGIETFVAAVMRENQDMLRVFSDAGFDTTRALEGGTVEVRFRIEASDAYRKRVDERDHIAVVASLRPFFEPGSVAVVGASARPGSIGGTVFSNVVNGGFLGRAHPVNRSGAAVAGIPAARSLAEIGEPVELVVICVPAAGVLDAAAEALRAGAKALCVIAAGFAETGLEGQTRQDALLRLVRAHGARLIGPNCLGIAVSAARLNATFARTGFPPGPIGFASQSGALGLALLEAAESQGLGFSAFVSIGNKADVSSNDLLEWWEEDDGTPLVLLYLESFGNPRKFGRVARRVARRKPVLAVKSGASRAGTRAAGSHTAALAGSEVAVEALFHQAGVIRTSSLEELLDVAALYSAGRPARGRRVAVLTNAGGLGILCADACEAAGLELPPLHHETRAALARILPAEAGLGNPVDMLGSATARSYAASIPVLVADRGIDAAIVLFVPAASVDANKVAAAVVHAAQAPGAGKPVLAVVMSAEGIPPVLRGAPGIAAFRYPESAARALGRAAERADWLRRRAGSVPVLGDIDFESARRLTAAVLRGADERWLSAKECRALLEAFGVPLVAERTVESVHAAVAAALDLGFPVAVKTAAPGVHKTEVSGVELNLGDEAGVRRAAERIGPPLLVQPMLKGETELLAGLVQDELFGPLVGFGPGGRLTELIGEASFRIAPLTDVDADELVSEGTAGRLVRGFRGAPAADGASLTDLLHRLSLLGEALPEVAELDLNPVVALPDRCVAVDVRARVRHPSVPTTTKTW